MTKVEQGNGLTTGFSQDSLTMNRRQVLGTALAGLAAAAVPGAPALAQGTTKKVDVLLIGGGIMSATLGVWLHELEPT